MPAVLKMRVNNPVALIRHAWENGYAIPAFNVCNLEFAKAIIGAAEVENSPIILQTYPGDLRYAGLRLIAAILRIVSDETPAPALLHLDHPEDLTMIRECLREGYMSVMFDSGHLATDQNVRETARIAGIAHAHGAIVEGELGQFGGAHQGMRVAEARSCDARRMFEEGRVDMLAVSVGSVHGEKSRLNLTLLKEIAAGGKGPLVLHGGSGIDADDLKQAIRCGVVKVNIGAAIIDAWLLGLKEGAALDTPHYPRHYDAMRHAMRRISAVARNRIALMGASNRADAVRNLCVHPKDRAESVERTAS